MAEGQVVSGVSGLRHYVCRPDHIYHGLADGAVQMAATNEADLWHLDQMTVGDSFPRVYHVSTPLPLPQAT